MGIVVIGAVFVDIKGYPESNFIPSGRNAGRVEQVHGGVARNVAEDIANCELRPTFVSLVEDTGTGADVVRKLKDHKVNTDYIRTTRDGMGTWLAVFNNEGDVFNIHLGNSVFFINRKICGKYGGGNFLAVKGDLRSVSFYKLHKRLLY